MVCQFQEKTIVEMEAASTRATGIQIRTIHRTARPGKAKAMKHGGRTERQAEWEYYEAVVCLLVFCKQQDPMKSAPRGRNDKNQRRRIRTHRLSRWLARSFDTLCTARTFYFPAD